MLNSVEAWGATYPGRKVGPNQDRVLMGELILTQGQCTVETGVPYCAAVADGVSGDAGGEIAAQTALEALAKSAPRTLPQVMHLLDDVNMRICLRAESKSSLANMCTTIAGVWVHKDAIVWCTRGDSPVFLAGPGRVTQVSHSHTDDLGRLTSYLGANAHVTMQTTDCGIVERQALQRVQTIVLMTDGVARYIGNGTLRRLVRNITEPLSRPGMQFLREAFANGSRDNMSVQIVRVHQGEPE